MIGAADAPLDATGPGDQLDAAVAADVVEDPDLAGPVAQQQQW
jgi:hypothetical protein